MQDAKNWQIIFNHLSKLQTAEEEIEFAAWLKQSKKNQQYFNRIQEVWELDEHAEDPFLKQVGHIYRKKLTRRKIRTYILEKALGNLVGFIVGIWVVSSFTHTVLERKNLKNLFGLIERKRVVVNEIPLWMQNTLAILIGYLVLELIAFVIQSRMHVFIGKYIRQKVMQRFY